MSQSPQFPQYDPAVFPKVSLLILAKNDEPALKGTLLSALEQCYDDYEVFIACSDYQPGTSRWVIPQKQGVDIRCFSFGHISGGSLLNTALTHLRGLYVQILFPGYVYLSPYTLQNVMQIALEQQFPAVLYTATLRQGEKPEKPFPTLSYYPLSSETLRIGQTPTELPCCWIRRDLFKHIGEWGNMQKEDYAWHFFCELNCLENLHNHGIKRVFMEHQIPYNASTSSLASRGQACRRILRTFGPRQALRYLWNI